MAAQAASAVAGLIGSGIDAWVSQSNAKRNIKMQREFAQHGVRWKVDDAKKAGVHPLAALGAQTHSFSPVSVGSDFGTSLANAGQDISRAMNATRTGEERQNAYQKTLMDLQIERGGLENEILRQQLASSIARSVQASGPPMQSHGKTSESGAVPTIMGFGQATTRDPRMFSAAQTVEDEYGDIAGGLIGTGAYLDALMKSRPQYTLDQAGYDVNRAVKRAAKQWWNDWNNRYSTGGSF